MRTPVQLLTSLSFLAGDNHHQALNPHLSYSPADSHKSRIAGETAAALAAPVEAATSGSHRVRACRYGGGGRSWGRGGLIVAKELKRLQSNPQRLDGFIRGSVSRLQKSDLVAVLAEFQRQDQLFEVMRQEIWYRPDMFFYRDTLMMLAKNKVVDEVKQVWADLKGEEVLFDQHTLGDIMRVFLDSGLPKEAMKIYYEMRQSPDPPFSLPYRVILKGLVPYPELSEKVKDDFLELFPGPREWILLAAMEVINHVLVSKTEISLMALLVIPELLTLAATWKATRKTAEVATTAPEVASMATSTTMFNVVGLGIGFPESCCIRTYLFQLCWSWRVACVWLGGRQAQH
ncbi:Pentatricopeptide repeat-containing protein [Drosera capensis]